MQPEHAKFLLDFFLPRLKSEHATTMKVLRAVPSDRGDYQPDPKCRSSFQLAWHLAATEIWFLDAVMDHVFREDDAPRPPAIKTSADIAEWYAENFTQRIPRLEALSGEHLATPVDYIGVLNDPAVAYLCLGIRHSVHHRGQLSSYLRPMGAKVPAIYIESADEPFEQAPRSAHS